NNVACLMGDDRVDLIGRVLPVRPEPDGHLDDRSLASTDGPYARARIGFEHQPDGVPGEVPKARTAPFELLPPQRALAQQVLVDLGQLSLALPAPEKLRERQGGNTAKQQDAPVQRRRKNDPEDKEQVTGGK